MAVTHCLHTFPYFTSRTLTGRREMHPGHNQLKAPGLEVSWNTAKSGYSGFGRARTAEEAHSIGNALQRYNP